MKKRVSFFPVHMFLFALYPILALLSENVAQMGISAAYRSILASLLIAGILLLLMRLVSRSWLKAAAISSLILLLFFSYGHVYSLLKSASFGGFLIGRHRYLIPLWTALLALGFWMTLSRVRDLSRMTRYLNLASVLALVLPVSAIATHIYQADRAESAALPAFIDALGDADRGLTALLPDVYYIIVDAYARTDILRELYGYDNSGFEGYLDDHGFYIAKKSESNYLWTHLSLASSLNMDYIQGVVPGWSQGDKIHAVGLIKNSRVRSQLEGLGYSTVAFATGWSGSELFDADYVMTPGMTRLEDLSNRGMVNAFEGLLIQASAGKIFADIDSVQNTPVAKFVAQRLKKRFTIQREIILGAFDNLQKTPAIPGPKFVFVHIISPHGPYIFGPNGEVMEQSGSFTLARPSISTPEEEIPFYLDQLTFITTRLVETIDMILSRTDRPLIIILQSDHGPGLGLDWVLPRESALISKSSILNAYLLPAGCTDNLYPAISPVNSFRVVLNCIMGDTYDLLEDETYFGIEQFILVEDVFIAEDLVE